MKVYIANVGVTSRYQARGLMSPIFLPERRFEFIIIEEGWPTQQTKCYKDLRSFYDPSKSLIEFIPNKFKDVFVHLDPNFDHRTYGDVYTGRGANLYQTSIGDLLLYIARLVPYSNGRFNRKKPALYFIGELKISEKWVFPGPYDPKDVDQLKHNAHIIREIGDNPDLEYIDEDFVVFQGAESSGRYQKAVPITEYICDDYMRDKNGKKTSCNECKKY